MSGLTLTRSILDQSSSKYLAQHTFLLVVEVGEEQREDVTGAVLKDRLMGRIERRDQGFEQVHVRDFAGAASTPAPPPQSRHAAERK